MAFSVTIMIASSWKRAKYLGSAMFLSLDTRTIDLFCRTVVARSCGAISPIGNVKVKLRKPGDLFAYHRHVLFVCILSLN